MCRLEKSNRQHQLRCSNIRLPNSYRWNYKTPSKNNAEQKSTEGQFIADETIIYTKIYSKKKKKFNQFQQHVTISFRKIDKHDISMISRNLTPLSKEIEKAQMFNSQTEI